MLYVIGFQYGPNWTEFVCHKLYIDLSGKLHYKQKSRIREEIPNAMVIALLAHWNLFMRHVVSGDGKRLSGLMDLSKNR